MDSSDEPPGAGAAVPRLLLVDSSANSRRTLKSILEAEGWSTVETTEAREALALASVQDFEVVITNLELAPLDGLTLVAALLNQPSDRAKPEIIVYAANIPDHVSENLRLLGIPTLNKPVDARSLTAAVHAALERKHND